MFFYHMFVTPGWAILVNQQIQYNKKTDSVSVHYRSFYDKLIYNNWLINYYATPPGIIVAQIS
mgnify:CR=1 FL=1